MVGGDITSPNPFSHSNCLCLKKRFASIEAKKRRRKQQVLTRKKVNVFGDKTDRKQITSIANVVILSKEVIYLQNNSDINKRIMLNVRPTLSVIL